MRFAYLILAHDAFDQLSRLCARLLRDCAEDAVFLHIDAKSTLPPDFLVTLPAPARSRVIHVPRLPVYWAHHSQCDAIQQLLTAALPTGFDHYHLLSGRDWPLVPRSKTAADIAAAGDHNCFVDIVQDSADFAWRMDQFAYGDRLLHPSLAAAPGLKRPLLGRGSRVVNAIYSRAGWHRPHPLGPWVKGSQWWSLPHDAAAHASARLAELQAAKRLRFTQCSDEHVIQTALANSPFATRIAGNRRLILWPEDASSPKILERTDMAHAGDAWFGRKFDAAMDPSFYDY